MNKIYVVSDGTGRTAEQALNAALAQFPGAPVDIIVRPNVRTVKKRAREVILEAAEARGFVVHTIVRDAVRKGDHQRRPRDEHRDDRSDGAADRQVVGDAGRDTLGNPRPLRPAEQVLFPPHRDDGLSSSVTTTASALKIYARRSWSFWASPGPSRPRSASPAFKGWFVANVPIVMNQDPPDLLAKLPPNKVFCLDTNARELAELRRARQDYLKGAAGPYADPEYIRIELMQARKFYGQHSGWPVINVTNKPIEEIAAEILAARGEAGKPGRHELF